MQLTDIQGGEEGPLLLQYDLAYFLTGEEANQAAADRDAALARVRGSARLDDLAGADLVVEAVVEELSVKQALFATLDEICKPGAVLATTTSSLPVIDLAAATGRPADVVGLHFFNPAQVMRLVEVVHTVSTAPDGRCT